MNYYNPYYYMMSPSMMSYPISNAASTGLFSRLTNGLRGIGWSGILNNTQRTLGVINQAIPLVKQATPMFRNAKTMFQIMNEFKKVDTPSTPISENTSNNESEKNTHTITTEDTKPDFSTYNGPTFFQ